MVGQSPGPGRMVKAGLAGDDLRLQRRDLGSRRGRAGAQAGGDRLKQAGFAPSVTEEPTADPAEDGVVINQFPPAGSRGQRGDLVTITVGVLTP